MLSLPSIASRSGGARGRPLLGLFACLSFGCPGVEPSTSGLGGAGGEGVPTTSVGGRDNAGGGGGDGGSTGPKMGGMSGVGGAGGCEADLDSSVENCGECGRKCVDEGPVEVARCVGGVCAPFCKSGFVDKTRPETGPDDGCETPGRRVFVTEDVFSIAELESVSNADMLCQTRADAELLGGDWRAWLSEQDDSSSPSQRFTTMPAVPYMLLDFTSVAASFAALTNGKQVMLDQEIDLTELGLPPSDPSETVWTATTSSGLASGNHCSQWTAVKDVATVGSINLITAEWTEVETLASCTGVARLYCFEQ